MGRRLRKRAAGPLLAFSLVAGACSGVNVDSDVGDRPDESPTEAAGLSEAANGVPDSLAFMGDVAIARSAPLSITFDAGAGELDLGEGAQLHVPAGSFATATPITAQIVELDYRSGLGDAAPWGRAFVVSTVDSVDLDAPVIVEVPRDGLGVMQLIDGEIVTAQTVEEAGTTRIEIPHFSEVITMVTEAWATEEAARATTQADYLAAIAKLDLDRGTPKASPADFLLLCLATVTGMFGEDTVGGTDNQFLLSLAMSVCTNALIERSSPNGKYVSTACVGDKISGGLDFQPAVDACATESDGPDAADDDVTTGGPENTDAEDDALAPDSQLDWTAMLETDEFNEPTKMTITRIAGTDDFTIEREGVSIPQTDDDYLDETLHLVTCTKQVISFSSGTGTFDEDASHLVFAGDGLSQTIFVAGPCADGEPLTGLFFSDLQLEIGPEGLEYDSPYAGVGIELLPGSPPRPIGQ